MERTSSPAAGDRAPLARRGSERPWIRLSGHPLPLGSSDLGFAFRVIRCRSVPNDLGFAFRVILCRSVLLSSRPLPAPDGVGPNVPTSVAAASEKVIRSKIVSAMRRNADSDSRGIYVAATGHEVSRDGILDTCMNRHAQ